MGCSRNSKRSGMPWKIESTNEAGQVKKRLPLRERQSLYFSNAIGPCLFGSLDVC